MPKQEAPLHQLKAYLPEGSFDAVVEYLLHYKVQLTITKERKSVLGDYRNSHANENHRISVNGNLNKYAFLVTLLHELAHLFTYERFGHRVSAHGQEWKNEFSKILAEFLLKKVFLYCPLTHPLLNVQILFGWAHISSADQLKYWLYLLLKIPNLGRCRRDLSLKHRKQSLSMAYEDSAISWEKLH